MNIKLTQKEIDALCEIVECAVIANDEAIECEDDRETLKEYKGKNRSLRNVAKKLGFSI